MRRLDKVVIDIALASGNHKLAQKTKTRKKYGEFLESLLRTVLCSTLENLRRYNNQKQELSRADDAE